MKPYVIVNFYKFVPLDNYESLKPLFLEKMAEYDVKGTIILASEGINGSFCSTPEGYARFSAYLASFPAFSDLYFKENFDDFNPFDKSKVKLRKEIVSLGVEGIDAIRDTGVHVEPKEWNALISDENVLVIDTRNDYEFALGTFENAINPKTINFRDFPEYVKNQLADQKAKKVAMFCTGGIRCEKSTAYLKQLGFEDVYQLNGGILNYLASIPAEQSLWKGDCFVFDNRVAIDNTQASVEKGSVDLEWKNKFRQSSV